MFGPLAFVAGRGFYGVVGVLPMVVAAAYGAGFARRSGPRRPRGLRSRIGLHLRRGVTAFAALAVGGLVYLLVTPASVPPIRDANGNLVPGSIASLEKVRINGSDQWIEIRAWSPDERYCSASPAARGRATSRYLVR